LANNSDRGAVRHGYVLTRDKSLMPTRAERAFVPRGAFSIRPSIKSRNLLSSRASNAIEKNT